METTKQINTADPHAMSLNLRELVEVMHEQLDQARQHAEAALRREVFLQTLVMDAHKEIARLRTASQTTPPAPPPPAPVLQAAKPAMAGPRAPGPVARPTTPAVHVAILDALGKAGDGGLTRVALQELLGRPLSGVLDGMARRKTIRRIGNAAFALPTLEVTCGPENRPTTR